MTLAEELAELRRRKDAAEEIGRKKQAADGDFKEQQALVLRRMEAEECASFRHPSVGYLFTAIPDRVKGQVDDRRLFVRWALENDESIQEFLGVVDTALGCHYEAGHPARSELVERFYDAIMNTTLVHYQPDGTACNSMAKAHVDDETPLPPGLSFRPDPYIQQLKS